MKKTVKALVLLSFATVSSLAMAQNVTHDAHDHQGSNMERQVDQAYQKDQIRHDDARRIMSDKKRIKQYKAYVQHDNRPSHQMSKPVRYVKVVKVKHVRHIRYVKRHAHPHHKMAR